MGKSAPKVEETIIALWIARVGLPASILSAFTATVLLIGDLAILFFGYVPLSWELDALRGGTALALVLSLIGAFATFAMLYRWLRIARGKQRLNLKEEATDQALDAPDYLDRLVPQGRRGILRGCQPALAVGTLLVTVALTTLTLGPGPVRVLAVGPLGPEGRVLAIGAAAPSSPRSTSAAGTSCHPPAPPAGFSTLTSAEGVCWNYPSDWSTPIRSPVTVVSPNAQDYFTVFETTNSVFNSLTPFLTRQTATELGQSVLGSDAKFFITNESARPPQTTVTLGSNTWTEVDTAPNFTVTRGGTTFDVTLLLTHHAGIHYLVIVMAPRDTASAVFTTFFQPMVQSLTFGVNLHP